MLLVTSAGFEPATNGAEIRYSIQLNYEANKLCVTVKNAIIKVFLQSWK